MVFNIITIFPHIFDSYFNESLFKRALKKGIIKINIVNLREFSKDKHRKVDDSPFGGGPGMVIKLEPIAKAVSSIRYHVSRKKNQKSKVRTILFSTRGKIFDQKIAKRLSKYDQLILICGRYEGVDERAAKYIADEEISMGDYILSGGELPAMALVEAVSRYQKGFLGTYESLEDIKGSYPVYTRPSEFYLPPKTFLKFRRVRKKFGKISPLTGKAKRESWDVPKVLLSGNHKEIDVWRRRG